MQRVEEGEEVQVVTPKAARKNAAEAVERSAEEEASTLAEREVDLVQDRIGAAGVYRTRTPAEPTLR